MAIGIDIFKERFANYSDQYTIIGGMACELLMNEAALDFRATRDIDMVLNLNIRVILHQFILMTIFQACLQFC